jgi:hypothetical protein
MNVYTKASTAIVPTPYRARNASTPGAVSVPATAAPAPNANLVPAQAVLIIGLNLINYPADLAAAAMSSLAN